MIGTLENLFDYEQIEDAWKAILGKKHRVYLEFCDDDKNTTEEPYIEVNLQNVVPVGQYPYRDEILTNGWEAVLISRVVTARGFNSDKHREMVGSVRLAIQRYRGAFNEAILPYHSIEQMRETSLSRGVDELHDWSEVHAKVVFYVRDGAWPK